MLSNETCPISLPAEVDAMQREAFAAIQELIEDADTIAICAHTAPDGDALGTQLALSEIIGDRWPEKQVTCLLADNDECPRLYRFLPGTEGLVKSRDFTGDPDLFIAVDLSQANRLNEGEAVLKRSRKSAIMDHHPCDAPFADANLVRPQASAAGIIVLEFALYLGIEITPDIAQNIMCAIVTDTGRFQYGNTDSETFECASLLVECGANPAEISLNVYQSFRLQYLHLKSAVLGRIKTFDNGRIAYSYATASDLERTGADLAECDGLVDVVRSVEGAEVALFLKTVAKNKVRGNLRSKGTYDVSKVARAVGGGGHRAAAGFTFEGEVDDALAKVLPLLEEVLHEADEEGRS